MDTAKIIQHLEQQLERNADMLDQLPLDHPNYSKLLHHLSTLDCLRRSIGWTDAELHTGTPSAADKAPEEASEAGEPEEKPVREKRSRKAGSTEAAETFHPGGPAQESGEREDAGFQLGNSEASTEGAGEENLEAGAGEQPAGEEAAEAVKTEVPAEEQTPLTLVETRERLAKARDRGVDVASLIKALGYGPLSKVPEKLYADLVARAEAM